MLSLDALNLCFLDLYSILQLKTNSNLLYILLLIYPHAHFCLVPSVFCVVLWCLGVSIHTEQWSVALPRCPVRSSARVLAFKTNGSGQSKRKPPLPPLHSLCPLSDTALSSPHHNRSRTGR